MAFVLPDELHLVIRWLGGNFFLICTKRPDNLLPFARRGELSRDWGGVSPPHTPPREFRPWWQGSFRSNFVFFRARLKHRIHVFMNISHFLAGLEGLESLETLNISGNLITRLRFLSYLNYAV